MSNRKVIFSKKTLHAGQKANLSTTAIKSPQREDEAQNIPINCPIDEQMKENLDLRGV